MPPIAHSKKIASEATHGHRAEDDCRRAERPPWPRHPPRREPAGQRPKGETPHGRQHAERCENPEHRRRIAKRQGDSDGAAGPLARDAKMALDVVPRLAQPKGLGKSQMRSEVLDTNSSFSDKADAELLLAERIAENSPQDENQ